MRVDPKREKPLSGYVSLSRRGMRRLRELVEAGDLRPIDLSVLLALIEHVEPGRGYVQTGCEHLSLLPGMPSETSVQYAVRRLESAGCLRRSGRRRRSRPEWYLNPELCTSWCRHSGVSWHLQAWHQLEAEAVPPPPPTASVIAAGIA